MHHTTYNEMKASQACSPGKLSLCGVNMTQSIGGARGTNVAYKRGESLCCLGDGSTAESPKSARQASSFLPPSTSADTMDVILKACNTNCCRCCFTANLCTAHSRSRPINLAVHILQIVL